MHGDWTHFIRLCRSELQLRRDPVVMFRSMRMRDQSCASVPSVITEVPISGLRSRIVMRSFLLIMSHVCCALIVPKRRGSYGVTRCALRSRLRLRESVRGSDGAGRKKKHERFISDGRQLFRSPQSRAFISFSPLTFSFSPLLFTES